MRSRHHVPDRAGGFAGVDEVVDDQPAVAVADIEGGLQNLKLALRLLVVGRDGNGIDHANFQLPRDDRGGDHAATGHGNNAGKGAFVVHIEQAP